MKNIHVHSATCSCWIYQFSVSAALCFLYLRNIVYFKKVFFCFLFHYQKTFLPVWNHQWRVTFIYYASLHFCAFCLLECIVKNQRIKGTWMRNEVHRYREGSGSVLHAGISLWKCMMGLMWCMNLCSLDSGFEPPWVAGSLSLRTGVLQSNIA